MKEDILKVIIFILLLFFQALLSVWFGVPWEAWCKVQILNICLFSILWFGIFWLVKNNPHYVGMAFMLVLMVIIVLFKVLVERMLDISVLSGRQRLILISSFLVYLVFTVALLIKVLKNIRINEKKD